MIKLPTPNYQNKLEKSNAINNDIILTIHKNYPFAVAQTKGLANYLKGETPLKTAKKVWLFLKSTLKYKRDPEGKQMIKLPSRLLATKERVADCKSYSLLAASLLANNGLKPMFRYTSYKENERTPTHVYVVTADEFGNEIIVDGCYKTFNDQKQFTYKYDYPMDVYTLSGIDGPLKKLKQKAAAKKAVKKEKKAEKKADKAKKKAVKKEKKAIKKAAGGGLLKKVVKKVGGGVKKVAVAPARAAYLGLVRLNVKSFATKLAEANAKDSTKIKNWWTKLGGNYNELMDVVNKGKTKKPPLGIKGVGVGSLATIGTAIVTAAPIIVASASILKSLGVKSEAIDKVAEEAGKLYQNQTGESAGDAAKDAIDETTGEGTEEKQSFFTPKNIAIGAGALAAIIFLPKLLKSKK